jgi:hypothetical protein
MSPIADTEHQSLVKGLTGAFYEVIEVRRQTDGRTWVA